MNVKVKVKIKAVQLIEIHLRATDVACQKRTHPALTPASEGWYSMYLYPGGMEG